MFPGFFSDELHCRNSCNIKWLDLNKMKRHKKEYYLSRGVKRMLFKTSCVLWISLKYSEGSFTVTAKDHLVKKHQGSKYRHFLYHSFMGPVFLNPCSPLEKKHFLFCMWIHFLHKYSPILLFSHLPRHKKMLNQLVIFHGSAFPNSELPFLRTNYG